MHLSIIVFAVLCVTLVVAIPAFAVVESTFDSDLDGWMIVGDNSASWASTGGNPGGYLDVGDLAIGQGNWGAAPSKFLGDWTAFGASDTLSYDVYFETTAPTKPTGWMFQIIGPGGRARGIVPGVVPPVGQWSTFKISLAESDWTLVSGTWATLLSEVTSLELAVEYAVGPEEVRLDNVRLTSNPTPVFSPCASSTFNDGSLETWSFTGTGGVTNPGDDGNSLGYLDIPDLLGLPSYVFAPSRYLGNWSSYDDAGYLTIDVRVITRTGPDLGSWDFFRLSGPGGSAHAGMAAGTLPLGSQNWKTYEFRLRQQDWIVDSGTWAGLLAEVTECRIHAEFFNGDETIGLDNFGRLLDTCPPVDSPVVVYVPDVSLCDTYGFVDVHSVTMNPVDSLLYGLVRDAASTGGGFYALSGPQAGVRRVIYDNVEATQLIFDDDGDAYVTLHGPSGNVQRIANGSATSTTWVSGFHSGDDDPWGMAFAPPGFNGPNVSEGDIVVTDPGFNGPDEIWSFSPDVSEGERRVTPDPGNADWYGITHGPGGTMWVTDALVSNTIFELKADGSVVNTPLATPLASPQALRYSAIEVMFYVTNSQSLYRLDPTSWIATLVADGFRSVSAAGLSVAPDQTRLWLADYGADRVYEFCFTVPTAVDDDIRPPAEFPFSLAQNEPNPFNPATTIRLTLPVPTDYTLVIYDVGGRLVRHYRGTGGPGEVRIVWDGTSNAGNRVSSGVYFYRLKTGSQVLTRKAVLLK